MIAVAPGKAFLFGEYAVLEGAPALLLAVARHARARVAGPAAAPSSLSDLVAEVAHEELPGVRLPEIAVDSTALCEGDRKLGLGSSAAACVATAALFFHAAGESLAVDDVRRRLFRVARTAHDRLQGEPGSGADVAASVAGGVLRYESASWTHATLPATLRLLFVDSGESARTGELVRRVRALQSTDPHAYVRRLDALGKIARAASAPDVTAEALCLFAHGARAELDALGHDAGIPLVTPAHRRIAEQARAHGCAAKPSGAGGGDLAVVFCPEPAAAFALRVALAADGFSVLELPIDATGVRLEVPGD